MKHKRITVILIMIALVTLMYGCKNKTVQRGNVKVIFELEGGTYKSSERAITYGYTLKGDSMLIREPKTLAKDIDVEKPGYELVGWYRNKNVTKTEDGEVVTYSDKWDFANDRITADGITLYANWRVKRVYSFDIYYYDENNKEVKLCNYVVNEGGSLDNEISDVKSREGYTFIKFLDEKGNPWDMNYKLPGGEMTTPIKVFAQYIKGTYKIVRTRSELQKVFKYNKNSNIYLDDDIDMEGKTLYYDEYNGILMGNNHRIYNFKLTHRKGNLKESLVDGVLYISMFGEMSGAKMIDVTFDGVTCVIDAGLSLIKEIYIIPIAKKVENTSFENVKFKGTYQIIEWPSEEFNVEKDFTVVDDKTYLDGDEKSQMLDTIIEFIESEKEEN